VAVKSGGLEEMENGFVGDATLNRGYDVDGLLSR